MIVEYNVRGVRKKGYRNNNLSTNTKHAREFAQTEKINTFIILHKYIYFRQLLLYTTFCWLFQCSMMRAVVLFALLVSLLAVTSAKSFKDKATREFKELQEENNLMKRVLELMLKRSECRRKKANRNLSYSSMIK